VPSCPQRAQQGIEGLDLRSGVPDDMAPTKRDGNPTGREVGALALSEVT